MFEVGAALSGDATSLGGRFAAARLARDLPIEKVAHETRIRAQRIREIENDDLSHFSHPSYARMFLSDYARYLDIPLEEIKPFLPATGAVGCEGYQYLQGDQEPAFQPVSRSIRPLRVGRAITALVLFILCAIIAVQGIIMYQKLGRIGNVATVTPPPPAVIAQPEDPVVVDPVFPAPAKVDNSIPVDTAQVNPPGTIDSDKIDAPAPVVSANPETPAPAAVAQASTQASPDAAKIQTPASVGAASTEPVVTDQMYAAGLQDHGRAVQ